MDKLEELKGILRIDWTEEDGNLAKMIKYGEAYINHITGVAIDFDQDKNARSLLLDYCRYRYHNATEEFEKNFSSQLLSVQIYYACRSGGGEGD